MKKIICFLTLCAAVGSLGSCTKKAAATPGTVAKQYVEHIMNDDYEAFVDAISFTEPVAPEHRATVNRAHASALRTIHQPNISENGGIKEVKVVSEEMAPDNKSCDVTLSSHYNNGMVKTIDMTMINEDDIWKVRETPRKEIWKGTTSEGDTEVIKVRSGHERDFIKDKDVDTGEKQFIKDINHRNGNVEVVKVLENGRRSREVIRNLGDGVIEVDTKK